MVEPVPIPDRFVDSVAALYKAQRRAEETTGDAERNVAQSIARDIISELSSSDDPRFAAAIHQELATALVLGCPSREELGEAADILERSLEMTDRSDPILSSRAALLAHVSVLLAIAEQDKNRLNAAIAAAELRSPSVQPGNLPCLIETMMALSFVRGIDPDIIRSSVGESDLFGFATIEAEKRALAALASAGRTPVSLKLHIASARIHAQYAVYQEQISESERTGHAAHGLLALGRIPVASLRLLRRDVPFAVVLAASAATVLAVGLALATKEDGLASSADGIHDQLDQLAHPRDLSPVALTKATRHLARAFEDLAVSIAARLLRGVSPGPERFDVRPLLDIIDEFSRQRSVWGIAEGMWMDLSSTAAETQRLLERG